MVIAQQGFQKDDVELLSLVPFISQDSLVHIGEEG